MIEDKDNWQEVVSNWQHADISELESAQSDGQELPCNNALITRVNMNIRKAVIDTILIVLLSLVLSGYILMEIIQGLPSIFDYVLYFFFLSITLAFSFYTIWLTRNTWRSTGHNSKDYITLLLKQANSRIKLINISKKFSIACLVPVIAILLLILGMWLTGQEMKSKHTLVSIALMFSSLILIAGYFHLKKQSLIVNSRIQQLHSMLKTMS